MLLKMAMEQKRLPIGVSDFKKLIEGNYAYIDKSLLISELMEKGADVVLVKQLINASCG